MADSGSTWKWRSAYRSWKYFARCVRDYMFLSSLIFLSVFVLIDRTFYIALSSYFFYIDLVLFGVIIS